MGHVDSVRCHKMALSIIIISNITAVFVALYVCHLPDSPPWASRPHQLRALAPPPASMAGQEEEQNFLKGSYETHLKTYSMTYS